MPPRPRGGGRVHWGGGTRGGTRGGRQTSSSEDAKRTQTSFGCEIRERRASMTKTTKAKAVRSRRKSEENGWKEFSGEINFSSKLVKVTKEEMMQKPKKSRSWKGRRAAERMRRAEAEALGLARPPEDPTGDGPEPPDRGDSFADFLTALDSVPGIEDYFHWALPRSPEGRWDGDGGCGAPEAAGTNGRGPPWLRFYFGIFLEKLSEWEQLKRQEEEAVKKIEQFMSRKKGKAKD